MKLNALSMGPSVEEIWDQFWAFDDVERMLSIHQLPRVDHLPPVFLRNTEDLSRCQTQTWRILSKRVWPTLLVTTAMFIQFQPSLTLRSCEYICLQLRRTTVVQHRTVIRRLRLRSFSPSALTQRQTHTAPTIPIQYRMAIGRLPL